MVKKRIYWIDALKGFATILVVLGHVFDGYLNAGLFENNREFLAYGFKIIYGFHMPLFFIVSGYVFQMAYIKDEKKKLDKCQKCLDSLIEYSRTGIPAIKKIPKMKWKRKTPDVCSFDNQPMNLYLFEVNVLKPYMKQIGHRIKLLKEKAKNLRYTINKRIDIMPRSRFKIKNYIKITGRAQGKYCNNLFKYDYSNKIMTYISCDQRKIKFPLIFPHKEYELLRVLKMGHAHPGKAVCYTLTDHGDYFIISASITLPEKDIHFDMSKGVVGMDINVNHVALAETDGYGNMIWCGEIRYDLHNKTSNQKKAILQDAVIQIIEKCKEVNKPLIKEELDFEKAKEEMEIYNQNKKFNRMQSSFNYRVIDEKITSRAYKESVGVMRVDPAYTSRIGDIKYRRAKGISVHKSAAYVIGRRGMGYQEKMYGH